VGDPQLVVREWDFSKVIDGRFKSADKLEVEDTSAIDARYE